MFEYQKLNASNQYALPEELEYIRKTALGLDPGAQTVILGGGPCTMAVAMLEKRSQSSYPYVAIIDIEPCDYCVAHLEMAEVPSWSYETFQADSAEVGWGWKGWVDFLIVDADHSYDAVRRDIRAWWPVLRVGGIAFFHDYLSRESGFNGEGEWLPSEVAEAIERSKDASWGLIKQVGISIVYRKV